MIKLKSFAKINLGLEISGKRPDGYHSLRTVFQTIDLFDTIEIRKNRSRKFRLKGSDPSVPWDQTNTVSRVIERVISQFPLPQGFDIFVSKQIPAGSGLGGGSGNAAVMLLFLNEFFQLGMSLERLRETAQDVGADVPFFLLGGSALGEGRGEILTPLADLQLPLLALRLPKTGVSTRLVFSKLSLTNRPFPGKIDLFLQTKDFTVLENNLEDATFALFPEIGKTKEKMKELGCEFVQMTGSGGAVFAFIAPEKFPALKRQFPDVIMSKAIGRRYYQENIGVWPSGKASAFGAEIRRFESSRPS